MIRILGKLVLTMFNIGKLGKFPGTIASAITSLLYIFFFYFNVHYLILFIIFIFLFLISIHLINILKDEFEDIDSKEIVIDEYLGQSIPILFFYFILFEASASINFFLIIVLISFIGFRFFDILKPYPINYIDNNFKNGFGVVFDDIIAGIFTTVVLYIFILIYDKF
ncbi:MAG: phosphatidylglycerophosphatase A [Candidatus Pelagibacter sp.]